MRLSRVCFRSKWVITRSIEQLFVEHFVEVLNMDNNSGGSRELFRTTWSFDENLRETLQHLRLVWMLLYIEVILLDVYRTSAYDAGENREPTLLNKMLLKLTRESSPLQYAAGYI